MTDSGTVNQYFRKAETLITRNRVSDALRVLKDIKNFICLCCELTEFQKQMILADVSEKIVRIFIEFEEQAMKVIKLSRGNFYYEDYFEAADYVLKDKKFSQQDKAEVLVRTMQVHLCYEPLSLDREEEQDRKLMSRIRCGENCLKKAVNIYKALNMTEEIQKAYIKKISGLWENIIRRVPHNIRTARKIACLILNCTEKEMSQDMLTEEIKLILAQCYHLSGKKKNLKSAIKLYEELLSKLKVSNEVLVKRCIEISGGNYRRWAGQETRAVRYFLTARNLADCYLSYSQNKKAEETMEQTVYKLRNYKLCDEARISLAVFYRRIRNYHRALDYISSIKEKRGRFYIEQKLEMARIYLLLGRTEKVENIYNALYRREKDTKYLLYLAEALERKRYFEKALFYYRKGNRATKIRLFDDQGLNPSSTKKKSSRREKIEIVPQPLLLGLLRGKIHCFF